MLNRSLVDLSKFQQTVQLEFDFWRSKKHPGSLQMFQGFIGVGWTYVVPNYWAFSPQKQVESRTFNDHFL